MNQQSSHKIKTWWSVSAGSMTTIGVFLLAQRNYYLALINLIIGICTIIEVVCYAYQDDREKGK